MPRFDIVFIDPLAFVDQGFPELALATAAARAAGASRASLRIPRLSVVREWLTPSTRAQLETWLRAHRNDDTYRELTGDRIDALRPELLRRLHNVARRAAPPMVAVLTLDEAWARELHRSYPGLPILRFEGARVRGWFEHPSIAAAPSMPSVPSARAAPASAPRLRVTLLRSIDDAPLAERKPVGEGVLLGGEHRGGRLGARLAVGGEGWIHTFEHPRFGANAYVCKVLKRPAAWRRAKLERMLEVRERPAGVAWPHALVFDARGEWLGFLLPRVAGAELQQALQRVWSQQPPSRMQLVHYARRALARVAAVHAAGAFVGDLQPKNFLLGRDAELTLIDADSFQLDGYPCPVGIVEYLHPELLGRDLKTLLRTDEHERFAVATLMFQILMGRQSPYAHIGGGTPLENQRKARFPYRRGRDGRVHVPLGPDGPAARMWSHLPYGLRQAFTTAFDHRVGPELATWDALLARYAEEIERGRYSNDAVPSAFVTEWRRRERATR
jgi:hypothetical protein